MSEQVKRKPPTRSTDPVLSFQLTLNPNREQEQQFYSHLGAVRYTYNWTVALIQRNWEQIKQELEAGEQQTEYLPLQHTPLLKLWNASKEEHAPWWSKNAKQAYDWGILSAVAAYQNFLKSRSGKRKGKLMGYPRFKKRNQQSQLGCMFNSTTLKLAHESKHVNLPRIGLVRYHGNADTVKWLLTHGARITQGVLKQNQTRWTFALTLRVPVELYNRYLNTKYKRDLRAQKQDRKAVGVDMGLKTHAVLSDGVNIPNPKYLGKSSKKLAKANRRLARRSGAGSYTMVKDERTDIEHRQWSKRHEAARKQLAKVHAKVANQRKNHAHQLSYWLSQNYEHIGIENLNIPGMVRNKHLSKAINDAGWGQIINFLSYKAERSGVELTKIGRFYPSSKTCSKCGTVRTKLSLSEREYVCECGYSGDRDHNAAVNIARESLSLLPAGQQAGYTLAVSNQSEEPSYPWVTGEVKDRAGRRTSGKSTSLTHRAATSSSGETTLSSGSSAMLHTSTL